MFKITRIAVCLTVVLSMHDAKCPGLQRKPQRRPRDKVVGETWTYKGVHVVGDQVKSERIEGRFRVYQHEVYRGPMKVGTIKPNGSDDSTMTITDWPDMNGKIVMKRIRRGTQASPPLWQGLLEKEDGPTWKLSVTGFEN